MKHSLVLLFLTVLSMNFCCAQGAKKLPFTLDQIFGMMPTKMPSPLSKFDRIFGENRWIDREHDGWNNRTDAHFVTADGVLLTGLEGWGEKGEVSYFTIHLETKPPLKCVSVKKYMRMFHVDRLHPHFIAMKGGPGNGLYSFEKYFPEGKMGLSIMMLSENCLSEFYVTELNH